VTHGAEGREGSVPAPRRYGEREIGRILERTTELQLSEAAGSGPSGMTLRELEEIATEAGIDPRYLRRAASEVEAAELGGGFWERVVGTPLAVVLEASVEGELPESAFERVVPIIQQSAREAGQTSQVGRTLTWRAETKSGSRVAMVGVSIRDGETRIRVEEKLDGMARELFGGLAGGVGVGAGIGVGVGVGSLLGSALVAAFFPVGFVAAGYLSARALFRTNVERRRRLLSGLLDALVAEVSLCVSGPAADLPASRRHLPEG